MSTMSELLQPIVTIEDGQLRGTVKYDFSGRQYYSFQGIPYAKPPIGKLRFKAPQPVDPWTGVKDVTKEGNDCYSRHIITTQAIGSEDCLFLNVYSPKLTGENEKLMPVMVWVHGGAFYCGSGSTELYGPDYLITEDVVIVTINYRLGLLGFSCFSDPSLDVPGNAGLKDQVQALRWVQRNILKFGGDPNNVTIFGESAGGASVHYLMLSPLTQGLFHKVIAQSGVSTSGWSKGQHTAPLVAKVLQLDNASEADIFNILYNCSAEKLLEIQEKLPDNIALSQHRAFGVVVESSNDKSAFLTQDPLDILASGNYCHVPLMIGYTSREGMLNEFMQKLMGSEIKWDFDYEDIIPYSLQIPRGNKFPKDCVERIKEYYFGSEEASEKNIDQYYLLNTDAYFLIDINNAVRAQTKTSSSPVYYYRVSVETGLNVLKKMLDINRPGVAHGDEQGYLFKNRMPIKIRPRTLEDISMRRFIRLWTTFAKYGDPNPKQKDNLININWPPTEDNKLHYLDIGENLTVGINPETNRVAFWNEIYDQYGSRNKQ